MKKTKHYINMEYHGILFFIVCRWERVDADELGPGTGIHSVCVSAGVRGRPHCGGCVSNQTRCLPQEPADRVGGVLQRGDIFFTAATVP